MKLHTIQVLEERISMTQPELIGDVSYSSGHSIVIAAAGKLGPSLDRLALRAIEERACSRRVVVVSIAFAGSSIDCTAGHADVVWQVYANEVTIPCQLDADAPQFAVYVTGPGVISVCDGAERFGRILHRPVGFVDAVSSAALLSDKSQRHQLFGSPDVSVSDLVEKIGWRIANRLALLSEPTKPGSRDGRF